MGWNKNRDKLHEAAFSSVKAISKNKELTSSTGLSQRPPIDKNIVIPSAPRSSKDLNKWHDYGFSHMQSPPVVMMSTGYADMTRQRYLQGSELYRNLKMKTKKNPDTKPNLEEIIVWRNNNSLDK